MIIWQANTGSPAKSAGQAADGRHALPEGMLRDFRYSARSQVSPTRPPLSHTAGQNPRRGTMCGLWASLKTLARKRTGFHSSSDWKPVL